MSTPAPSGILQARRRAAEDQRLGDLPDHDLLRRFTAGQDEAAFDAVLRRHGPMVSSVCRVWCSARTRTPRTPSRPPSSSSPARPGRSAGPPRWPAGCTGSRTGRPSRPGPSPPGGGSTNTGRRPSPSRPPDDLTWREVRQVVHEELDGLSDRYRGPLVLCYLEGRTLDQAAGQLGLAKGTLKVRLERARAVLRARLVRRGLGSAAVLLASAWPAAADSLNGGAARPHGRGRSPCRGGTFVGGTRPGQGDYSCQRSAERHVRCQIDCRHGRADRYWSCSSAWA